MFKQLTLACLCACSLPAIAQELPAPINFKPDSTKFAIITGKIDKLPNDSLVQIQDPYNGDWDTARVVNHSFKIKRAIPKGGSMCIMTIGSHPDNSNKGMLVYVEDGKLDITGKGDGFRGVKLSGSTWAKESQEVTAMVLPESGMAKEFDDIHKQWQKANDLGDQDLADSLDAKGGVLQEQMIASYKTWIKAHPNSGLSAYLVTCYIPKKEDRDALIKGMGEHALHSRIMMRFLHPGLVDEPAMKVGFNEGGAAGGPASSQPKIGTVAPEITAANVEGKMVSLSGFRGKYVLVDFWASWCGPCKGQIPFLKAANDKFKDKNFVLLGVSLDNKHDAWAKAIEKEKLDWIQVSGLKGWGDDAALAYGISAIPANVLIGPDGKIVAWGLYDDNIDKVLSSTIQ